MIRTARLLLLVCLPIHARTIDKRLNLRVPMRDGVKLSANLFRPAAQGKYPLILVRTPYGKGADIASGHQVFVDGLRGDGAGCSRQVRVRRRIRCLEARRAGRPGHAQGVATQPWTDGKVG